jgi:hypothetical protein
MYAIRPGAADEIVQFLTSLYSGSLALLKRRMESAKEMEADGAAPSR